MFMARIHQATAAYGALPALVAGIGLLVSAHSAFAQSLTARGNEPAWSITIGDEEIELLTNFGQDRKAVPTPAPEITTRYVAEGGLSVTVANKICTDTMSGMFFPLTVTVEQAGADTLSGCGGESVALLAGDEWTVESIEGKPVVEGSNVTMTFDAEGRVYGSASCNRFTGGFTLTGEGLSIGDVASTMMACIEPDVGDQEHRFLQALAGVTGFEIAADGALVLLGNSGPLVVARR